MAKTGETNIDPGLHVVVLHGIATCHVSFARILKKSVLSVDIVASSDTLNWKAGTDWKKPHAYKGLLFCPEKRFNSCLSI